MPLLSYICKRVLQRERCERDLILVSQLPKKDHHSRGPDRMGGGGSRVACRLSLVACLNFKKSRVSALSMFHVAVGNLTKGCRLSRFHLSVVAAF